MIKEKQSAPEVSLKSAERKIISIRKLQMGGGIYPDRESRETINKILEVLASGTKIEVREAL